MTEDAVTLFTRQDSHNSTLNNHNTSQKTSCSNFHNYF